LFIILSILIFICKFLSIEENISFMCQQKIQVPDHTYHHDFDTGDQQRGGVMEEQPFSTAFTLEQLLKKTPVSELGGALVFLSSHPKEPSGY
jgi:hypothetical protein